MKQADLKTKATEKLKSELKATQILTGALCGVLTVLFLLAGYGLLTQENNVMYIALLAVAISCSGMLPIQFGTMKKIKNELKLRGSAD